MGEFRNSFAENIFYTKYAQGYNDTWTNLARRVVEDVTKNLLTKEEQKELEGYIREFKFIPGGRYLYYAGRKAKFYNNCYLLKVEEDTREEWANLVKRSTSCLMSGGGIGIDYSVLRPAGYTLSRTGGVSSGPIPLMQIVNEIGRNVMQGGIRRSAIYASLNWQHEDVDKFLVVKNWSETIRKLKEKDFNFSAPLDMTNISLNYDDKWLALIKQGYLPETYIKNVKQALRTGDPGFSFNFGEKRNETLRNASKYKEPSLSN